MYLKMLRQHASSVFSILYATFAIYFITKYTSFFALHPFLMLSAYALMAKGILIFDSTKTWKLSWNRKMNLHWIIQLAAGLAVALGFLCIYSVKVSNGKEHFTTWHGTIGLSACILLTFSMLGGVFNYYKRKFMTFVKPRVVKSIHKYFGLIAFLIGLVSIGFGFTSTWAENEIHAVQRWALIASLIPFAISVIVT